MSEARAITNLIGNGVATIVIARWEGALDIQQARAVLARDPVAMADEPEIVADSAAIPALRESPQESGAILSYETRNHPA